MHPHNTLKLSKFTIEINQIIYLTPEVNYTRICYDNTYYLSSYTMKVILSKLPDNFIKLGRFSVVNKSYVESYSSGVVKLRNGVKLKVTRRYLKTIEQILL